MSETATAGLDRAVVEGIVFDVNEEWISLSISGTNYRLHLIPPDGFHPAVGSKVRGRVRATARRIDVIAAGGRYIEPVEGRPRRVQGRVISVDEVNDSITVKAVIPMVCRTNGLQKAGNFKVDQMVSFDVEPGARFEPQM